MVTAWPDLEESLWEEGSKVWARDLKTDERSRLLGKVHAKYVPELGKERTSEVLKKLAAQQGKLT